MYEGKDNEAHYLFASFMSLFISAMIVLFNKFALGTIFHKIVDEELYSTKTKFNIAFAHKLSIALFINSALVTYVVEILLDDNYFGPGGFIYTETWIFFWNFLLPPLTWFIV